MKIFLYPFQGMGHVNACIGLAQALRERGHVIYFLVDRPIKELLNKYKFDAIILENNTLEAYETVVTSTSFEISIPSASSKHQTLFVPAAVKDPLVTLASEDACETPECDGPVQGSDIKLCMNCSNLSAMLNLVFNVEPLIRKAINDEQPDLIIVDNFFIPPSIYYSDIPWVLLYSPNPLAIYSSMELPPPTSGYPTKPFSKYSWREFRIKYENKIKVKNNFQNNLMKSFDRSEISLQATTYQIKSPYLNIYIYPEELDYTDIVVPLSNCLRVDNICRKEDESFEMPKGLEEFIKNVQTNTDKLVYITMGSSVAINPAVLMKIVKALNNTPHKYIVSKGNMFDKDYQLPANMWGQDYVPQISILPMVDLVITHGGNNTVTEAFYFGKPMIVMPLFADQFDNAQRIDEKGYGIRINPYAFREQELVDAVNQLLVDEKLKQKLHRAVEQMKISNSKEKACIAIENLKRT